jgi:hypothetical protein
MPNKNEAIVLYSWIGGQRGVPYSKGIIEIEQKKEE